MINIINNLKYIKELLLTCYKINSDQHHIFFVIYTDN